MPNNVPWEPPEEWLKENEMSEEELEAHIAKLMREQINVQEEA